MRRPTTINHIHNTKLGEDFFFILSYETLIKKKVNPPSPKIKWGWKKKKGGKKGRKKRGKIGKYATKEMYLFAVWPFHWFQLDLAQVPEHRCHVHGFGLRSTLTLFLLCCCWQWHLTHRNPQQVALRGNILGVEDYHEKALSTIKDKEIVSCVRKNKKRWNTFKLYLW